MADPGQEREALKQADAAWLRMEGVKDEDAPLFYEGFEAGVKAALAAREDTERPDQYEDSRIANAVADALDHYERIGLDPHHWIVGGRVVDILRGRTPPVRDTERPDEGDREEMLDRLERGGDIDD